MNECILHIPHTLESIIRLCVKRDPVNLDNIKSYNDSVDNNFYHVVKYNDTDKPCRNEQKLNRPFLNIPPSKVSDKVYRVQTDTKAFNILQEFNCLNKGEWVTKTDVSCWWCCHQFDTMPLGLPFHYNGTVFKVKGCFCSFNCMLAYSDNKVSGDTLYLIHYLFRVLTKKSFKVKIQKAPPREMLKLFGGPYSIEEFRNTFDTFDNTKFTTFSKLEYPMIALNVQIEEHVKTTTNNNYTPVKLDNTRVESATNDVKINKSTNNTIPVVKNYTKTKLSDFFQL